MISHKDRRFDHIWFRRGKEGMENKLEETYCKIVGIWMGGRIYSSIKPKPPNHRTNSPGKD